MENYEEAAESRLKDWEILNEEGRKAGTIHFGGIYIECLLKSMICGEHNVEDGVKRNCWKVDGSDINRPSHSLTAQPYLNLLQDLYDDMPADVENSLEYITYPENISYIDYRYISERTVTDEVYQRWIESFICVFLYLDCKKQEI